jgi:hypothetical protein
MTADELAETVRKLHDALSTCTDLSMTVAAQGLELMRAKKQLESLSLALGVLREARRDAEAERDKAGRKLKVMEDGYSAVTKLAACRSGSLADATRLLEYALNLRQHGERAPGGAETWAWFDRAAEHHLRGLPIPDLDSPVTSYSPVQVPENTGKHPAESGKTAETAQESEREATIQTLKARLPYWADQIEGGVAGGTTWLRALREMRQTAEEL